MSSGFDEAAELPDDPRLMQAVQEYLHALEAGRMPNRAELLRRYADLEGPLTECLDGLDLVHKASVRHRQSNPTFPAAGPSNGLPGDGLPQNPLGDFQIVRELGRGGMGIVYEAIQLSLGRRVALKVLPFAATFDAKRLQRFHNEAQAAAQLHHTNIVPVHAVGCERGVHFYAMQLIDGHSLATMIEQVRKCSNIKGPEPACEAVQDDIKTSCGLPAAKSDPSSDPGVETISQLSMSLSTQRSTHNPEYFHTVARLMVQAAEAVEHAHQFGIVHRDIKPANLLVDAQQRLWVTDFGLAQFHADAGLTQTGDIVGTLRYMSPEQASGQRVLLDQRTDIYSLGATLYELVTLRPIFPGRNRQELLHQIIHEEPVAPRILEKSIPVELETIILKAVSKNPVDRYTKAQDLAADLGRYLADQPILAKRPTLIDRARKWSRRHPGAVAAGMLLLFVVSVALLVSNRMIALEQAKTRAALNNEKQRALEARGAVDLLVAIAEEELADLGQPHVQAVRKRLLEAALTYYGNFNETHGSDPTAQAELQSGKKRVRDILDELATLEGMDLTRLAASKGVQDALKASDDQRDKLLKLREDWREQDLERFRLQRLLAPEGRRQKNYEFAKAQETALTRILNPEQLKRLRQIDLQMQGPRAFHESYAVDVLKISTAQKRKLREIKEETMAMMWAGPPDEGGPGKEGPGPGKGGPGKWGPGKDGDFGKHRHDQLMKQEVVRILQEVLTLRQKVQWQELTGAPYEGPPLPPPFGKGPFQGKGPPGNGMGPGGPKPPPGGPFGPR